MKALRQCGVFVGLSLALCSVSKADETATEMAEPSTGCDVADSGASVRVRVKGLRDSEGNLRAQIYGDDPDTFLEKGSKLFRLDVPAEGDGQQMCLPLPAIGRYAIVILHDRNANGKADIFSEGFGFSNNPKLGLSKPDAEEVLYDFAAGVSEMEIQLKYLFGSDDDQQKKRRQLRRR